MDIFIATMVIRSRKTLSIPIPVSYNTTIKLKKINVSEENNNFGKENLKINCYGEGRIKEPYKILQNIVAWFCLVLNEFNFRVEIISLNLFIINFFLVKMIPRRKKNCFHDYNRLKTTKYYIKDK
ncbi:hypothetical protein BpHYR1_004180 [Brachionus plicatilis]|uniref:Uncharacterized protein n=1 Tax=Brachionus plicatilis TaxID=10195 RepID=A0A3M7Q445_BRAPC|nr:hypothetical protein BpHYR1_004180 [Brachionus plicatilis]